MNGEEIWLTSNDLLETNVAAVKMNCIFRTRERSSHCLYFCTPGSPNPMVAQMALVKINESHKKSEVVNLGKGQVGRRRWQKWKGKKRRWWRERTAKWIPYTWNCNGSNLIIKKRMEHYPQRSYFIIVWIRRDWYTEILTSMVNQLFYDVLPYSFSVLPVMELIRDLTPHIQIWITHNSVRQPCILLRMNASSHLKTLSCLGVSPTSQWWKQKTEECEWFRCIDKSRCYFRLLSEPWSIAWLVDYHLVTI